MKNFVSVIGGINIDIKGYPLYQLIAETSNPGRIYTSPGGVGRNIAHNLALLDIPVYLLGAVGDDSFGIHILDKTREAGVQVEHVRIMKNLHTGMYLSLLDQVRDLVVAIADMEIIHCVDTAYINKHNKIIQQSCFVILDTNLDTGVLYYVIELCRHEKIPFLIEPVSVKKTEKIRDIPGRIDFMTPNLSELEVLLGNYITHPEDLARMTASLGGRYQHLLVTLGEKGVFYHHHADKSGRFYSPLATRVVDATGAGDAFVAGFVSGMFHHYEIDRCIRLGIAASHITLQSEDTVNKDLSFNTCVSLISNLDNS